MYSKVLLRSTLLAFLHHALADDALQAEDLPIQSSVIPSAGNPSTSAPQISASVSTNYSPGLSSIIGAIDSAIRSAAGIATITLTISPSPISSSSSFETNAATSLQSLDQSSASRSLASEDSSTLESSIIPTLTSSSPVTLSTATLSPSPVLSQSQSQTPSPILQPPPTGASMSRNPTTPDVTAGPSRALGTVVTPTSTNARIALASVVVDGQTYALPRQGSLDIMQDDGSFITLKPNEIQKGGSFVSLPQNVAQPTALSVGGAQISLQPGKAVPPHAPRPASDLLDVFSGLSGAASQVATSVPDLLSRAKTLASGSSDVLLSGLADLEGAFANALTNLGPVSEGLESVEDIELQEFNIAERDLIATASDAASTMRTRLTNIQKLLNVLKGIKVPSPNLPAPVFDNAQKSLFGLLSVATPVILVSAEQLLRYGKNHWAGTVVVTGSKTFATPLPSSISTIGDKPRQKTKTLTSLAKPEPTSTYMIRTKEGTSRTAFDSFIKNLDGAVGVISAFDLVDAQTYVTSLTEDDAAHVKQMDIVDFTIRYPDNDDDFDSWYPMQFYDFANSHEKSNALRAGRFQAKSLLQHDKRQLTTRPNSDSHLKMIAQSQPGQDEDYLADDSLGRGTTIYILDTGFKVGPELDNANRKVETYIVPNGITLGGIPADKRLPEVIEDRATSHGSCVASVAAGVVHGVASNADLFLIKVRGEQLNTAKKQGDEGWDQPLLGRMRPAALQDAFDRVLNDVLKNKKQGKAVLNLSWGVETNQQAAEFQVMFTRLIEKCKNNGIVLVTAAGNDGELGYFLGRSMPQSLGKDDNILVTVGGTHEDGSLWRGSQRQQDTNAPGSISLYAQAKNIKCVGVSGETTREGTSFSAAAVSGLAAYFLTKPPQQLNLGLTGTISAETKSDLIQLAWERFPSVINRNIYSHGEQFQGVIPQKLVVAYNNARGAPIHTPMPSPTPSPGSGSLPGCHNQKRDVSLDPACTSTSAASPPGHQPTLLATTISGIVSASSVVTPVIANTPITMLTPTTLSTLTLPSSTPTAQAPSCKTPIDLPEATSSPLAIKKGYYRISFSEAYWGSAGSLQWTLMNDQNRIIAGPSLALNINSMGCLFPWSLTISVDNPDEITKQTLTIATKSNPAAVLLLGPSSDNLQSEQSRMNMMGSEASCADTKSWDQSFNGTAVRHVDCVFKPEWAPEPN